MRVKAIMTRPVVTVKPTTPLSKALALMGSGGLSGLAVVDDLDQLCGILSEGDMLRRVEMATATKSDHWRSRIFASRTPVDVFNHANCRRVSDVMSTHPITIDGDDSLADAARLMEQHHVCNLRQRDQDAHPCGDHEPTMVRELRYQGEGPGWPRLPLGRRPDRRPPGVGAYRRENVIGVVSVDQHFTVVETMPSFGM